MSAVMFLNMDSDVLLFKSLLVLILLAALWPLGLLGYLITVYGGRIFLW
jgi:hypothetical protein